MLRIAIDDRVITLPSGILRGVKMTRDMEVVRKVLLAIQARKDLKAQELSVEGVDDLTVGYHVALLHEGGFINGTPVQTLSMPYPTVLVRDLSWEGHDFVAALGNDTVWAKIKSSFTAADLVTLPLALVKDLGLKVLTEWAKQKMGQ